VRLDSITAIVEVRDDVDAEGSPTRSQRQSARTPEAHACPRGWITMQHELDDEEAAIWRRPDALNR
jgi:hypothetical protein